MTELIRTLARSLESAVRARRDLADAKTPKVARDWGFRMNMDYDSFQSTFDKFTKLDEHA